MDGTLALAAVTRPTATTVNGFVGFVYSFCGGCGTIVTYGDPACVRCLFKAKEGQTGCVTNAPTQREDLPAY